MFGMGGGGGGISLSTRTYVPLDSLKGSEKFFLIWPSWYRFIHLKDDLDRTENRLL